MNASQGLRAKIPSSLQDVGFVFVYLMVLQSTIRLAFALFFSSQTASVNFSELLLVFLDRGLLYDTYIASLISAVPAVFILLGDLFKWKRKYKRFLRFYLILFSSLLILFAVADIGYFDFYNSRLTKNILIWFDSPTAIAAEMTHNYNYILLTNLFLVAVSLNAWFLIRKFKMNSEAISAKWFVQLPIALISLFLLLNGIRGTFEFEDHPLIFEDSFIYESPFANQLGINGPFAFFDSFNENSVADLMNAETALSFVNKEISGVEDQQNFVLRSVNKTSGKAEKMNVVLILVESLSNACYSEQTTPFLKSLEAKSLYFPNAFSAGIHTYNGVFSSLYGLPAIMDNRLMASNKTASMKFNGLPKWLKENGYSTSFMIPGDKNFDNMNSFLLNNNFDEVLGEIDYPKGTPGNSWGVHDAELMPLSIQQIDKMHASGNPFFCSILTISSHKGNNVEGLVQSPYSDVKPDSALYRYTDKCLEEFFVEAKGKKWFSNTLFVILGDHGQRFFPKYQMPLNYHHIPVLFYNSNLDSAIVNNNYFLQTDVGPTVMSYLKLPYTNNTLGVNAIEVKRPYAYFSADDKIGVVDSTHYLIVKGENNELYSYQNKSTQNEVEQHPEKVKAMKGYAYSMMRVGQYLIDSQKTE